MMQTNGACPHCGKKIFHYNQKQWKYGSPIRTCKYCNGKYIDKRYHEIVIDGVAPDILVMKEDIGWLLAGLSLVVGGFIFIFSESQLGDRDSLLMLRAQVMVIFGVGMTIYNIVDIIKIKTGKKDSELIQSREEALKVAMKINSKRFIRLSGESYKRLQDKSYANELADAGYFVPEKYL